MSPDQAVRQLRAAADANAGRGSLLFHLDLATELARAALAGRELAFADLVATVDEGGYRVLALDGDAAPGLLAAVTFAADGSALVAQGGGAPPWPATLLSRGRRAAATAFPGLATVVIPPAPGTPGAELEGYAVARSSPGRIALGRHWRFLLAPGGDAVRERVTFSDADQAVPETPELRLRQRGAVPDEILTYLSLKHGAVIDVRTDGSGLSWRVSGERTRLLPRAVG